MNLKNNLIWIKHFDFIIIDLACLVASFVLSYYFKFESFGGICSNEWLTLFIIICATNLLVSIYLNIYSGILRRRYYDQAIREIPYYGYQIAVICLLFYVLKIGTLFSREMLVVTYALYYLSSNLFKYIRKRVIYGNKKLHKKNKLLVVCSKSDAKEIVKNVLVGDAIEYEIKYLYLIDSDEAKVDGISVIKNYKNKDIQDVLIATNPAALSKEMFKYFIDNGICIHFNVEKILGYEAENVFVQRVGNYDTFSINIFNYDANKLGYYCFKRLCDILFGIIGVLVTLGVGVILKVIYMISGDFNPILYKQKRVGKNGKIINIYKFRSMVYNADEVLKELLKDEKYKAEWEENQKFENDPRVTKIGKIIRKLSIDELPQFVNVLKGEMSIIGPRPLIEGELEQHNGLRLYNKVKPGITGWWACNGRSNIEYRERLELEYYYIHNCSIKLDIICIIRTVLCVLKKEGAK